MDVLGENDRLKNLGLVVQKNDKSEKDLKNMTNWGWMKVLGILCDKKMPIRLKSRYMLKSVVISTIMFYSPECWAMNKWNEQKMNEVEGRMLKWI